MPTAVCAAAGLAERWQFLPAHVVAKMTRTVSLQDADYDDLIGAGHEGLMRAARAFDPSRGFTFSTLAWRCISRCVLAEMDRQRHQRLGQMAEGADPPAPEGDDPAEAEQQRALVAVLLLTLSLRERTVLRRRFLRGETLAEVSGRLGVSKERVRQIEIAALEKLRRVGRAAARASANP